MTSLKSARKTSKYFIALINTSLTVQRASVQTPFRHSDKQMYSLSYQENIG